jgi:hypothetical protein
MAAVIQSAVGGYQHTQDTPSTTWVVPHNIGTNAPIVDCYIDVEGEQTKIIPADVVVTSTLVVTIEFTTPQVGTAYVI